MIFIYNVMILGMKYVKGIFLFGLLGIGKILMVRYKLFLLNI